MLTTREGIFVLFLLALACGKTSPRDSGEAPGSGGIGGREGSGGGGEEAGGPGHSLGGKAGSGTAEAGAGAGTELSRVELEGAPIYTRVQRLTNQQWEHAVTDVLRFAQAPDISASFLQPVLGTADFDNNETILFVGPQNFGDFESGAEAAAALATGSAEALAALYDGDDVEGFVRTLGRRAFRRPLTPEEELKYHEVFAHGETLYGPGFANGAALVIRAMLQSPHFLYRTELGPVGSPLNGYEVAAKLSFWLLGTTPNDSLLDAASAGELDSDEGIEATARRMLDEPGASAVMRAFHDQLLHIHRYEAVSKVGLPEYDEAINRELALASYAFVDHVFQANLGLKELLTAKRAFVGPLMAPLYGLDHTGDGLELRELGPSRSGYFMQIPYLMLWGQNDQSDAIRRGLFLQKMTCGPLPLAAAQHGLIVPPFDGEETDRQRTSRLSESCSDTCHSVYINPLGFSLENFDGLGRERRTDNGQPVDTTGSYPFAEGVADFADGNELMSIMAASEQVHTCYSKKVTGYALGRDIVERDRPLLESLSKVSQSQSLKEIIIALARDPAFRTRQEGPP